MTTIPRKRKFQDKAFEADHEPKPAVDSAYSPKFKAGKDALVERIKAAQAASRK